MPKITLSTLGIETDAPIGFSYMDKGEINNPAIYSWFLTARYEGVMQAAKNAKAEKRPFQVLGKCSWFFPNYEKETSAGSVAKQVYTYVKRGLPEPLRTFVLGHEEGHALDALLGLRNLDNALEEAGVQTSIPVRKWPKFRESVKKVHEAIADAAGLYALLRSKYSSQASGFSTSASTDWNIGIRVQLVPALKNRLKLLAPWEIQKVRSALIVLR